MNGFAKVSVALGLTWAMASAPVLAQIVERTAVGCGASGGDYLTIGTTYCSNRGEAYFVGSSDTYNYRIQATALADFESGGLHTSGKVVFENLQESRVGPHTRLPAGTDATVSYQDLFRFTVPTAAPGSMLTMRTVLRMQGVFAHNVDPSRFTGNNAASMRSEFSVVGLGIAPGHQFFASVDIRDGAVTTLGKAEDSQIYEQTVTLNANKSFISFVSMNLGSYLWLANGALSDPTLLGVGSGQLDADFSSTAGVVSIEFYNSQNQIVPYSLIADSGQFAFLPAVPEPATYAMMLLGLCAIGGLAQRRQRAKAAAAVA